MSQVIEAIIENFLYNLCVYTFGKIVINRKNSISKIQFIHLIILATIVDVLIFLNLSSVPKTLLMLLIDIIIYKRVFCLKNSKAIFMAILYTFILILSEMLVFISIKVFKIDNSYLYNNLAESVLINVIIFGILLVITMIFKYYLRQMLNNKIKSTTKIIIYSLSTLACIVLIFYKIFSDIKLNLDFFVYVFSMVIFTTILFSLIRETISNAILSEKYENVLDYMSGYEHEVENQRIVRHEAKNELIIIKSKIYDGESSKELMDYIDEILDEKVEFKEEKYAKFGYLPPNGIKGLLYFKAQQGQNEGLNISLNVSSRVENSNIYNLNSKEEKCLGKILGVFLDNAVEASLKSKAKEFGIEVYLNSDSECEIIIGNSFDEDIDVTKIGKERFSTKGKTRGHGLLLVNLLLEMNKKAFNVKTDIGQGIYVQTITIKKRPINRIKKKKHSNK